MKVSGEYVCARACVDVRELGGCRGWKGCESINRRSGGVMYG